MKKIIHVSALAAVVFFASCETKKTEAVAVPAAAKFDYSEKGYCDLKVMLIETRDIERKMDKETLGQIFSWNEGLERYVCTISLDKNTSFSDGDPCHVRVCADNPGLVYITLSEKQEPVDSLALSFKKYYDFVGTATCFHP